MRNKIQPYLFWILLLFLAVGIVYPVIGVIAIICMLAPIITAFFKGRYWCGNLCPRGSFWDNVIEKVSPKKPIPAFFRSVGFRIFMVFFIIGVFSVQMYYAWGDLAAMGAVFVRIILITTVVGVILGVFYHQRTWCSFCPMGTMASWLSALHKSKPLKVTNTCVDCKLCTSACPLQLTPYEAKGNEKGFTHSDCLKCSRCVEKCPKKALTF
ncbi:MAG: 4Fe-4S binding protein [Bacillota bacterium]